VKRLRKRTPGLAQALLAVGPATRGWNSIPGSEGLTRFELGTPVRSAPEFAEYLDRDVVPVFETRHRDFATVAGTWPPVKVLPGIVLGVGALLAIYGAAMLFVATIRPKRN
jgi:hypothetical protein